MTIFQTALIIPAIAIGTTFDSHQVTAAASRFGERTMALPKTPPASAREATPAVDFVSQRKTRIQNVLVQLDRIAQVTAQLKPETADRVEPVIVDLAEQTIELATPEALSAAETDQSLNRIEETVTQLTRTMNRYVEPEATL